MLDDILGHEEQKNFLLKYLQSSSRPHALLFLGDDGLGKKKLAFEFAKMLLCSSHTGDDGCEACRLMNLESGNLSHPDILFVGHELDEKTNKQKNYIGIDQIRDLIANTGFAPVMSDTKVCIIDAVDSMRVEAANAFLKILEEPPVGWVMLLIAESDRRLLPTILSRVVRLRFHAIDEDSVTNFLQTQHALSSDEARLLARAGEGSIGLALELKNKNYFDRRKEALAFLEALPLSAPINYLAERTWQKKIYERDGALVFLKALQLLLRDLLMCKNSAQVALYNFDLLENLNEQTETWRSAKLKRALVHVQEAYTAVDNLVGTRAVLESMALKIDLAYKE